MMEDHGQILTYFENMFGEEIEHEVIKMVLQTCNWNSEEAAEKLLNLQPTNNFQQVKSKQNTATDMLNVTEKTFPKLSPNDSFSNLTNRDCITGTDKFRTTNLLERPKKVKEYSYGNMSHLNLHVSAIPANKLNYVINLIKEGKEKILIIIRGLPGSGKSTLSKLLIQSSGVILSTDDFFYDSLGNYNFNSQSLTEAHNWNKNRTKINLVEGKSPIIIDNTNLQMWEFCPYVQYALDYGFYCEILEPDTPWKYNTRELARRNIHNIPKRKIDEMNSRFDKHITIENVIITLRRRSKNGSMESETSASKNIPFSKYSFADDSLEKVSLSSEDEPDIVIESSDSSSSLANDYFGNLKNYALQSDKLETDPKLFKNLKSIEENLIGLNLHERVEKCDLYISSNLINLAEDNFDKKENGNKFCENLVDNINPECEKLVNITIDNESSEVIYENVRYTEEIDSQNERKLENISYDKNISNTEYSCLPIETRNCSNVGNSKNYEDKDLSSDLSQDLFDEIVSCFSNSVKQALQNKSALCLQSNQDLKDDSAMYELLSLQDGIHQNPIHNLPPDTYISEKKSYDRPILNLPILAKISPDSLNSNTTEDYNKEMQYNDITHWQCLDNQSVLDEWSTSDTEQPKYLEQLKEINKRRQKYRSGDPLKWLNGTVPQKEEEIDQDVVNWGSCKTNIVSWDDRNSSQSDEKNGNCIKKSITSESLPYTGAIPKYTKLESGTSVKFQVHNKMENYSQVCASDFLLLKDGNAEAKSISVLFGVGSRFVPGFLPTVHRNEPLTKSKLLLDKSSMTDNLTDLCEPDGRGVSRLKGLFPDISKSDLKDILTCCNYDIDWAVNILIDGGYDMCDSTQGTYLDENESSESDFIQNNSCVSNKKEEKKLQVKKEVNSSDDKHKRIKQNTEPEFLKMKETLENNFLTSQTLDDKTRRLTGKVFAKNFLGKTKVKKKEAKESLVAVNTEVRDSISPASETECDSREGAQYLTLEVDPLFASQLVNIFGPVNSLGMNTNFSKEDYRVVLPLEICHEIHKYWAATLDGNFQYETAILDRFIRDDEELAKKLQEEEDKNEKNSHKPIVFDSDPPTSFQEIVDIERAISHSNIKDINGTAASYSHAASLFPLQVSNLTKLQGEFCHIDPSLVERIYADNSYNYENTQKILLYQFGSDKDTSSSKTVFTPGCESFDQDYNESMIEEDQDMCEEEYLAINNPQIYRDEAQIHYLERKKAFLKAQEASQNGMKAVAAYYAQVGNAHEIKFKEANQRASQMILNVMNAKNKDANTLDLHLLHVPEAIQATQRFLYERKSFLSNRKLNQLQVSIITGRGKHSLKNEPRLKPAIKFFLEKEGYSFQEVHAGMLKVTI